MGPWSSLLRSDPERLAIETSKVGIRPKILALDICDVPEFRERCKLLSESERLALGVDYFGDQRGRQPRERRHWNIVGRTPDWGQLPRLEGDEPPPPQPRQREPDPIAEATVEDLTLALAQRKEDLRKAKRDGRKKLPHGSDFTQENIAESVKLDRTRVQQAEGLQRVGWDLLRSDPDFLADDGFVRWPGVAKARQILASERAEN